MRTRGQKFCGEVLSLAQNIAHYVFVVQYVVAAKAKKTIVHAQKSH
jgi:hypothetical protein